MNQDNIRAVTDNVWTVLTSRVAMIATPFVASALVYLGSSWLDGKFAEVKQSIEVIKTTSAENRSRLIVLEAADRARDLIDQKQDIFIQSNKDAVNEINGSLKELARNLRRSMRSDRTEELPPWPREVTP